MLCSSIKFMAREAVSDGYSADPGDVDVDKR